MAKVTIVIKDTADGNVWITSNPPEPILIAAAKEPESKLTLAHHVAIHALKGMKENVGLFLSRVMENPIWTESVATCILQDTDGGVKADFEPTPDVLGMLCKQGDRRFTAVMANAAALALAIPEALKNVKKYQDAAEELKETSGSSLKEL